MRPLSPLLAGMIAALVLAGCSGEDSPETTDNPGGLSENPSKAEYIAAADEICQTLYEQRDPLENQAAAAAQRGDTDDAAATFENAAAITEQRFAELEALPRPAGDEQTLDRIYEAGGERTVVVARQAAAALIEDDQKALARVTQQGGANTARFSKLAIDYGMLVCGRGQATTID